MLPGFAMHIGHVIEVLAKPGNKIVASQWTDPYLFVFDIIPQL